MLVFFPQGIQRRTVSRWLRPTGCPPDSNAMIAAFSDSRPLATANICSSAVVLYTDGVIEAWHAHPRNEDYGINRLTAVITAAPRKAGQLLAHIEADFNAFADGAPPQDDVTFLVLTKD